MEGVGFKNGLKRCVRPSLSKSNWKQPPKPISEISVLRKLPSWKLTIGSASKHTFLEKWYNYVLSRFFLLKVVHNQGKYFFKKKSLMFIYVLTTLYQRQKRMCFIVYWIFCSDKMIVPYYLKVKSENVLR